MSEDKINRIRLVLSKEQLMTFVGGLHQAQLSMIDEAVDRSDLRQAQEIIEAIRKKSKES